MNLFDAHSIVTDLGLIGILFILFAETGLLIGLAFPGDSLLFIAGIAASATGAALLNGNQLPTLELFILAPVAAITGSFVGRWFGEKYGRKLFDRPDGRFFTQARVVQTEKWLAKYGIGKALLLARFIPFVRTLINPVVGIIGIQTKVFIFWNILGAIVWTDGILLLGYLLGEKIEGSIDKYLLPIIGLIIALSLLPILFEIYRERKRKKL
ncbi:MAG: VTT domain-containing protein [Actinobacteria bacterium]|nr:VTT domain-containing protein [Actinomycetota bacterium]